MSANQLHSWQKRNNRLRANICCQSISTPPFTNPIPPNRLPADNIKALNAVAVSL